MKTSELKLKEENSNLDKNQYSFMRIDKKCKIE